MLKHTCHGAIILVLSLCFLPGARAATALAQADTVEGLWGAESILNAPVAGEFTIDGRDGKWLASIAGFTVPATLSNGHLTFDLPTHQGTFRGYLQSAKQELTGEWIQPSGLLLDQQYASHISFRSSSPHVWHGVVEPLDERFSAYLLITSDGVQLSAMASNPEGNFFRRRLYKVTQNGSSVLLEVNGKKFAGTYDKGSGTLVVQLADWLPAFRFTRRTRENAIGFYPRLETLGPAWTYRSPMQQGDGWRVSDLHRESMDETPIAALVDKILTSDPTSTALNIQSLLVARHGKLVLEEYFHGFSGDRVHDMRSAGKTFAPVLVGVARKQGADLRPDTSVYSLFPMEAPLANVDDRKRAMKLRDIMTMTAGNACDDGDDNSPGNEDHMQSDSMQPNWYKFTLDLPMKKKPGGDQAVYCSGDLNLVGGTVAASTHTWLPDFFEQHVAGPLQFGKYYLNLMPNGEAYFHNFKLRFLCN